MFLEIHGEGKGEGEDTKGLAIPLMRQINNISRKDN